MITLRKSQLLIALAAACVFSAAYGQQSQQSEQTKHQLQFVISGTISPERHFSEVTHYGYFHLVEDRRFGEDWTQEWITKTSQWNQMSEKQRQFILKLQNDYQYRSTVRKKNIGRPFSIKSDHISTPEGTVTYWVPGVSEEDVRKMAEAVIERFDNRIHDTRKVNQKNLDLNKNVIAEAENMIPKLETEYKQLDKQVEEKSKEYLKTNYGIDGIQRGEVMQHTQKNMEELARYMKLAKFELIGLHARINSMEKFKTSEKIRDPGTLIKLDQMLITDQIEEAGVVARINAYEETFNQAKKVHDIIKSYYSVEGQKLGWERRLEKAKKAKNSIEKFQANPPAQMQPVEVYENKVFIWQLKQD
jgi:hypothetical protein